jgi:hypothetical protein
MKLVTIQYPLVSSYFLALRSKSGLHMIIMYVVQKVRFPIFYLNKIISYGATREAEIHPHISFTSPHSHQVCVDTYHSNIWTCQVLQRKKSGLWAHKHFLTSFWTSSLYVSWMCKNSPASGVHEISSCGSTVRSSIIIQKKNSCGQQS